MELNQVDINNFKLNDFNLNEAKNSNILIVVDLVTM